MTCRELFRTLLFRFWQAFFDHHKILFTRSQSIVCWGRVPLGPPDTAAPDRRLMLLTLRLVWLFKLLTTAFTLQVVSSPIGSSWKSFFLQPLSAKVAAPSSSSANASPSRPSVRPRRPPPAGLPRTALFPVLIRVLFIPSENFASCRTWFFLYFSPLGECNHRITKPRPNWSSVFQGGRPQSGKLKIGPKCVVAAKAASLDLWKSCCSEHDKRQRGETKFFIAWDMWLVLLRYKGWLEKWWINVICHVCSKSRKQHTSSFQLVDEITVRALWLFYSAFQSWHGRDLYRASKKTLYARYRLWKTRGGEKHGTVFKSY